LKQNVGLKGVIMSASKRVVPETNKNPGASQENCPRQTQTGKMETRVQHGIGARQHHWQIAHLRGTKADSS